MRIAKLALMTWGILCGALLIVLEPAAGQSPSGGRVRASRKPGEVITRPDRSERWTDQLRVGSVAPEFTLPRLPTVEKVAVDAKATVRPSTSAEETEPQEVSLKQLRATRPVVLLFGSITCPPFKGQLESVDEVYEEFRDRVEFLFVYVREAHPDSILSVIDENGEESPVKIPQATDLITRRSAATTCQRTAQLSMPIAVDKIDNNVGKAYAGWPNRMVIVDTFGRVIFASDPSPRGTNAERLRAWLTNYFAESR